MQGDIEMKNISKKIFIITVLLIAIFILSGCGFDFFKAPGIEVRDAKTEMVAGDTQVLSVYNSKTEKKISGYLMFASSDPEIVTVDESGNVTAVSQGSATIYIQHTENKLRTEMTVNVTYNIATGSYYSVKNEYSSLSGDMFSFWSKRGYQKRVGNWDVLDIANIIVNKEADDYLFSEVYGHKSIVGEEVLLISDWGNADVYFDKNILGNDSLAFISEKYQVSLNSNGLLSATIELNSSIYEQIEACHGLIRLSTLPSDMEYRVFISYDYDIVKVNNYYSLGKLQGIEEFVSDVWNGTISSFLDSYTYIKTEYEIVNNRNAKIIIEGREK